MAKYGILYHVIFLFQNLKSLQYNTNYNTIHVVFFNIMIYKQYIYNLFYNIFPLQNL